MARCAGRAWSLLVLLGVAGGCAGDYTARTRALREAYQREDYAHALGDLARLEKKGGDKDRLLVLLDRGMVLHAAGKWEESIAALAAADRLSAELDFLSLSETAGTLVTNERERAYRGEDFEKLMISVLQALNYAQLGRDEEALVEVRRVDARLRRMVQEEKKPYEQLAIARYLGGVLYEDQRDWDAAYIDYASALGLAPALDAALAEPLLRLAKKTGRLDAYERLRERFPGVAHGPVSRDEGQLVVVVEAGLAPEKAAQERSAPQQAQELIQVPIFLDRGAPPRARVRVEGLGLEASASTVTDLRAVARVHLEDRIGRLLLQQAAGAVVKAGLAAGAGALTQSEEVGALTFLVLNAFNAPDLRSWLSLPAELQVARFRVPAGTRSVSVQGAGAPVTRTVEVRPGRVALVVVRQY